MSDNANEELTKNEKEVVKKTSKKSVAIAALIGLVIGAILLCLFTPYKLLFSPKKMKFLNYMTKDITECTFEAHKKYIDIHYVAYGTECIGYSDVKKLKEISYNEEKDAAQLEGTGDVLTLEKGDFMITFTQDAHMPCICKENPVNLGKMIAKIKA